MVAYGFAFLCWYSINEESVDLWLQARSLSLAPVRFHVLLDGLDPDLGKLKAHTQVEQIPLWPTDCKDLGPLDKDVQIFYDAPSVVDQNRLFQALGLRKIDQSSYDHEYAKEKPFLTSKKPEPTDQELTVIGSPRWFPFDDYWLIATMEAGGYGVRKGKACRLTTAYLLDLRFPGYVVKEISGKELLAWDGNQTIAWVLPPKRYDAKFWTERGLAISIQRPLFIKVLAVLLLILALVSMPFVALRSKPEDYLVNCVAYFLGLWAVRGILTVNAPKSPTIVDYAVLMLYCFQILIVAGRALWSTKRE